MTDEMCKLHQEQIHSQQIQLTKMEGDITHIKDRIDNGMSKTVSGLDKKFDEVMVKVLPKVNDNAWWIGWIKKGLACTVIVGLMKLVWDKLTLGG